MSGWSCSSAAIGPGWSWYERPSPPGAATSPSAGGSGRRAGGRRARAARSGPPGRPQAARTAGMSMPYGWSRSGPVGGSGWSWCARTRWAPRRSRATAPRALPRRAWVSPTAIWARPCHRSRSRRRGRLPGRLEDLVRVERAAFAEQLVGEPGRVGPGDREIVGHPGLAGFGRGAVQRASQGVAGPRVPRPAGRVAVPRQRSGSGSASQPSSSVSRISGRSSCGKWPAPSITRQRYGPST